jgi:hypothetical protein
MKKIYHKPAIFLSAFFVSLFIISISLVDTGCGSSTAEGAEPSVEDSVSYESSETSTESEENTTGGKEPPLEEDKEPYYKLLYQLTKNSVSKTVTGDTECFLLNFSEFMDGGIINPDGSDNKILELKKYPTSFIASRKLNSYYYIYSPNNPVTLLEGFKIFNWDTEGQTLIDADFKTDEAAGLKTTPPDRYPGDVLISPENKYLAYPMTIQKSSDISSGSNFIMDKFNPFMSDSSLVIMDVDDNQEVTALENNYNRRLFSSFSQFSVRDDYFYTIALDDNSFKFIRVSPGTGEVKDFSEVFTYLDWDKINWDEFFPRTNDYLYASFSLSPDEERMVIYKNNYAADMKNPCAPEAYHELWILNLENGSIDIFEKQEGSVADVSWNPAGSQKFALSVNSHSGCYPDYIEARIDLIDKNGGSRETLITEQKSKITGLEWSPDGENIAYDVYGIDFTGRLKLIDSGNGSVKELINTCSIKDTVSKDEPVLIIFLDWVKE